MKLTRAAVALPALLLAQTAGAVKAPEQLAERSMETAQGNRARAARFVQRAAPAARAGAWNAFVAARGVHWRAMWDRDTDVPLRIYGRGMEFDGASKSSDKAERAAWQVLEENLALLAPGASLADFTIAANVVHGAGNAMRTVSFFQRWNGMPVVGGAVSFLFKNDRLIVMGSTATPDVAVAMPATAISRALAEGAASDWIASAYGGAPTVLGSDDRALLPVVRERDDGSRVLEHRVVVPVSVDLASPRGRWDVFVDAATGEPVARSLSIMFGEGILKYKAPVRWPGGAKQDYPAAYTTHTVNGGSATSNLAGLFTWTGTGAATVTARVVGPYVQIRNQSGSVITQSFSVANAGSQTWDVTGTERSDAQTAAFVHTNLIKEFARTSLNDDLDWLDDTLQVFVNEGSTCNAYSTGDDIHFYVQSTQCANTARLADVVYHEFGHSLHANSIIPGAGAFDGALSEGTSDYLAATTTGDPGMARGFFHNENPMRHLDPAQDLVWPDDLTGEVHDDGEIIGGTLWDLRKALIAEYGAATGKAMADDAYYAVIQRATDIPSSYVEVLAHDDDDGDLSNGTPNKCLIDSVFAAHGLADESGASVGSIDPPVLDDDLTLTLELEPPGGGGACPPPAVTSATANWRLRSNPSTSGSVDFTGAGALISAQLPGSNEGVLQYQVEVTFEDGTTRTLPNNAADPWYETYVGPTTTLQCWDFEADPSAEGWTLGTGFSWGTPAGTNASDPDQAYAGSRVIGTDLGEASGDGDYEPNTTSLATSPVFAIEGDWTQIHLQYRRWLNVEDAFYDHAKILVDGQERWQNLRTTAEDTHHRDREWRFHDVDITADAADGSVQVAFHLDSDPGLEFGGWTIDQVCIVATGGEATCGDGLISTGEACDDGNDVDGDGCSACTIDGEGPGPDGGTGPGGDDDGGDPTGGCCSAAESGSMAGPLALGLLTLFGVRRRRARA